MDRRDGEEADSGAAQPAPDKAPIAAAAPAALCFMNPRRVEAVESVFAITLDQVHADGTARATSFQRPVKVLRQRLQGVYNQSIGDC